MRAARNTNRAGMFTVPAPVGGWNTRDALDAMPPTDAVILDNWWPTTGKVVIRSGYKQHSTGMGTGNVDTLAEYHSGATQKLIACANGNIYDATSSTAASLGSGFTVNNWQTANFNGRLFLVNGTDAPQDYDGSTLSATAWTGPTITNLIGVNVFKNRLFFWEKNSQDFWYATVNTITGALVKFPLSMVGQFGGNLIAMGTWTLDGGDGVDDYAVFVMSSGEVIVYQGTDPGDAMAWALVGVYRIGEPLSVRGVIKVGGDLLVMTTDDYVSLSTVLKTGQVGDASKLSGAVRQASAQAGVYGWQAILYRKGNMLLFNVPTAQGNYDQHVINTITGAASRFKDIPARCWGIFDGDLYFGGQDGKVYQADTGNDDNGVNIAADGGQAWVDFGAPSKKRICAIRPTLEAESSVDFSMGVGVDFNPANQLGSYRVESSSGTSLWDVAPWDVSLWYSGLVAYSKWHASKGLGYTVSPRIKVLSKKPLSWIRTDFRLEGGKNL